MFFVDVYTDICYLRQKWTMYKNLYFAEWINESR